VRKKNPFSHIVVKNKKNNSKEEFTQEYKRKTHSNTN